MFSRSGLIALSLVSLCGCGSGTKARYDTVELVTASGRVTLDGEPLAQAVVSFEDPTNGSFSFGLTDPSGYYKLQLDSVKAGVTVGKKAVRISTTRKILGLNSAEEAGESNSEGAPKAASEPEKVPTKYNQKSELTADVTPSQSQFNFELTSK